MLSSSNATKTKLLVRHSGWFWRAALAVMGFYIILFYQPTVDQPPIEFMFRWGVGPGFLFMAVAIPFTRVTVLGNTMRVWQMSLWRQKVYHLSFDEAPPPMAIRTNPGSEGPDSFTLFVQMVDGREIDITTWSSEAEARLRKHELMKLWGQNNTQ